MGALSPTDKQEIEELVLRYMYWLDDNKRDLKGLVALFTDEPLLVNATAGRFVGRTGLEGFAAYVANFTGDTIQMRHPLSNVLIEGDGDSATVKAILVDYNTQLDPPEPTKRGVVGRFDFDVVRIQDAWKLATMTLSVDGWMGGPHDYSHMDHTEVDKLGADRVWAFQKHDD